MLLASAVLIFATAISLEQGQRIQGPYPGYLRLLRTRLTLIPRIGVVWEKMSASVTAGAKL